MTFLLSSPFIKADQTLVAGTQDPFGHFFIHQLTTFSPFHTSLLTAKLLAGLCGRVAIHADPFTAPCAALGCNGSTDAEPHQTNCDGIHGQLGRITYGTGTAQLQREAQNFQNMPPSALGL